MNKDKAIKEIRNKYLHDYLTIHTQKDKISFFNSLLNICKQNKLDEYTAWCNGVLHSLEDKKTKAIMLFKKAINLDASFSFPWNRLGNVYADQQEYDQAIKAYNKAIELDENFVHPWNGLGIVYRQQEKYDQAIKAYKKAIELDKNLAYPWNGLGNMYYDQKKYEQAIKAFNKAIELDKNLAASWHGLGNVYYSQQEYAQAIEAYKKAIELDKNLAPPWNGLGNVYYDHKEYDQALKAYKKAKTLFKNQKQEYWISYCKQRIELISNLIQSEKNIIQEKKHDLAGKILKAIKEKGIEEKALKNKELFLDFVKEKPLKINKKESYFQVLRRWNSYTPIVADNYHISKGGGYFLKIDNKGIVIDPGFNFIDNFKGMKHFFWEIDAVFISHAHNDHASDLESILTLLNRYNNKIKGDSEKQEDNTIQDNLARKMGVDYKRVSEDKVEQAFLKSNRRKIINLYITKSTYKKYIGMLNLYSDTNYNIHIIDKNWQGTVNGIKVKAIKAQHNDIISDRDSIGFVFSLDNTVIVYTGDTGWNEKIEKSYKELADDKNYYKDKEYKLLIAHLGGFKEYEKNYVIKDYKKSPFYKNHLGRLGLAKINEILNPDICFISEFGEEFKGKRIELAQIYDKVFKNIVFFPADIGLTMDLKTGEINAITILNIEESKYKEEFIDPKNVRIRLFRKDSSLNYHDKKIDTGDLSDILNDQYNQSPR